MQYKSIPFTARITRQDNSATVAAQVQAMIDVQALQDWSFVRIEQTKTLVASESGCFGLNNLPAYTTHNAIVIFERASNDTEFIPQINSIAQSTPIAIENTPVIAEILPITEASTGTPIILTKKKNSPPVSVVTPTVANNTTTNTVTDNLQKQRLIAGAGVLLCLFFMLMLNQCNKRKQANYEAIVAQAEADRAAAAQAANFQEDRHYEQEIVPATTDNSGYDTNNNETIGIILSNYYNACAKGDATEILSYWSNNPVKYYNLKGDITTSAIEAEIYKDPCLNKNAQVIEPSSITKTGDDVYFDLHYTCERQPPKKSVDRNLHIHIKMNEDNKIYSIEEL